MKKFIADNLRYPSEALEQKVEGTVFIKYDVDHQGNVKEARVISSLGHGCDEEAVRIVKLLKFKVEKPRNLRVMYHKQIQIHFRLPIVKEQAPTLQLSYNYTSAPPSAKQPEQKEPQSYSYTISFS